MPRKTTKKSGNNAGCLIWLIVMLIVLVLFVVNWDKIQETMRNTGFDKIVKLPAQNPEAKPVQGTETPGAGASEIKTTGDGSISGENTPAKMDSEKPSAETSAEDKPGGSSGPGNSANQPASTTKPVSGVPSGAVEQLKKTRVVNLYFIRVEEDGTIVRREVKRTIEVSDSPLTDALNALLRGPGPDELANNLVSLIPPGTKLLSVQVRGSTAIINFSEEFMYNRYGVEGYAGQLKQVVYTATSFSNVKDVQILIEGQRYDYLGGEGVYIGKPISRSSL